MKTWWLTLLAGIAAVLGFFRFLRRRDTVADKRSRQVFKDSAAGAKHIVLNLQRLQARAQRRADEAARLRTLPSSEDTDQIVRRLRRERDAD
ncbi:MAG: hypothetical protein ACE5JX_19215 [Acidobacteriota bacterium]